MSEADVLKDWNDRGHCDCIETANEHLKEFNTRIEIPMWTRSGRLTSFVTTCKIDDKKRGKPKLMFASYCPFCGERYETLVSSQDRGRT